MKLVRIRRVHKAMSKQKLVVIGNGITLYKGHKVTEINREANALTARHPTQII